MFEHERRWLRSDQREMNYTYDWFVLPDGRHIQVKVFSWGESTQDLIREAHHRITSVKHDFDINWHCISMMRANTEAMIEDCLAD